MACHQREGWTRVQNSVADQDDENRIAPAGFDVNGEEALEVDVAPGTCPDGRHSSGRQHHRRTATHGERYQDLWPR